MSDLRKTSLAVASVCVFSAIACFDDSDRDRKEKEKEKGSIVTAEQKVVLDGCKDMTREEFADFLENLSKKNRISDLRILAHYHDRTPFGSMAVQKYVSRLSTDELMVFCCKKPLGSISWSVAFYELSDSLRQKEDVIEFVKQMATSSNPKVRAICYLICARHKWVDLVPQAKNDIGSKEVGVPAVNSVVFDTLGNVAAYYLSTVEK